MRPHEHFESNRYYFPAAKRLFAVFVAGASLLGVSGCASLSFPTNKQVDKAGREAPDLQSIKDANNYLAAARNEMSKSRQDLQYTDAALEAGIVGGVVTTALSTTLKWSTRTTTEAGIFTAAIIGVESNLSIKTQEAILDKGLDSLMCVEQQASATEMPALTIETLLQPVEHDMQVLTELSDEAKSKGQDSGGAAANAIAQEDLANAKLWLANERIPTLGVVLGVKIGVDSAIQTTIDQLNSTLPDGSAFAKISTSFPSPSAPTSGSAPKVSISSTTMDAIGGATHGLLAAEPTWLTQLKAEGQKLQDDMNLAKAAIALVAPAAAVPQISQFNCPVAPETLALQLSVPSNVVLPGTSSSSANVTITGGASPYTPSVTAMGDNLTPSALAATVNGNTIILKGSDSLKAGQYNLIVSDKSGAQKTDTIAVSAPPVIAKPLPAINGWKAGQPGSFSISGIFSDPQNLPLTYQGTISNNANPNQVVNLIYNSGTGVLSGTPPAGGTYALIVTATNSNGQKSPIATQAVTVGP